VVLCTWRPAAVLQIGDHFAMTGGTVCATERITIGDHVTVGANTTIMDTDFHPLQSWARQREPNEAKHAAIHIGDQVFIGMQCLILKGVTLGKACVIGAGSVVTHDVAAGTVVAGNPAREVGRVAMAEA
jgi:acetyltransferase-like isoleucine patch superfamily enzyme